MSVFDEERLIHALNNPGSSREILHSIFQDIDGVEPETWFDLDTFIYGINSPGLVRSNIRYVLENATSIPVENDDVNFDEVNIVEALNSNDVLTATMALIMLGSGEIITQRYVSPDGVGKGESWDDPASPSAISAFVALSSTETIYLRADEGDVFSTINIPAVARYDNPVTIKGMKSDNTYGKAKFVSDRTAWTLPIDPEEVTSTIGWTVGLNAFEIADGVEGIIFQDIDFERIGVCFNFAGDCHNLTIREIDAYNIRRLVEHPTNTDLVDVIIRDVEVVGHSKHAIRCRGESRNWHIHDVHINSGRQSGDNFAVGLGINDHAHDILVEDSSFLNCHDDFNTYWNGDGISCEEDNYNLVFRRVTCSGHTDGGIDLKGYASIYDSVFEGNKHGLRLWNHDITLTNCTIGPVVKRGGGGKASLVGTYTNTEASVTINMFDCHLVEDGQGSIIEHGLGLGKLSTLNVDNYTYDFHYLTKLEDLSNGSIDAECSINFDVAPVFPTAPWLNPNPYGSGAVTGTPGTAPTGWEVESTQNGLTRTITTGDGYADIRYAGTTTSTARIDTHFNSINDTPSIFGDQVEAVIDMEIIGTIPSLTGVLIRVLELDSSGISVGSGTGVQTFQNARTTYTYQREVSGINTAYTRNRLEFTYPTGTAIDITFRVYQAGLRSYS